MKIVQWCYNSSKIKNQSESIPFDHLLSLFKRGKNHEEVSLLYVRDV